MPSTTPGVIPQYVFHQVPLHASSWASPPGLCPQTSPQPEEGQELSRKDVGHSPPPNTKSSPKMVDASAQWEPLDNRSESTAVACSFVDAATEPDDSYGDWDNIALELQQMEEKMKGVWEPCTKDIVFEIGAAIKVADSFLPVSAGIQIQLQCEELGGVMQQDVDGDILVFFPRLYKHGLHPLKSQLWIFKDKFPKLAIWQCSDEPMEPTTSADAVAGCSAPKGALADLGKKAKQKARRSAKFVT